MGNDACQIACRGHPNITASHTKTLELTRDAEIGARATCVVGVDAGFDDADILAVRGPVRVELRVGDLHDAFDAVISPFFIESNSLIFRRGARARERTFAYAATKAADDLDRDLVAALAEPGAELTVLVTPVGEGRDTDSAGALYVVPLPIGNDADLSERAVAVLRSVDLVLAEDTRRYRSFAERVGLPVRNIESHHLANEAARVERLVAGLETGTRLAIVTDAGTPGLSDPGFLLVRAAVEAGIGVRPLAGASAVTIALSASGLPSDRFLFAGFMSRRTGERRRDLHRLADTNVTLVLYEAPHRLAATLVDIEAELADRDVCLVHDVTKIHEEFIWGTPAELRDEIESRERVLGEWTIIVGAPASAPDTAAPPGVGGDLDAVIRSLLASQVPARTISDALRAGGAARDIYRRVLDLKGELGGQPPAD